jgi:hypothetical protein
VCLIKQFIRYDRSTLICGVLMNNNDVEEDILVIWRIKAFSLVRPSDRQNSPQLGDFSTSDLGLHKLIEIYDLSLYVISSQVTVDTENLAPR